MFPQYKGRDLNMKSYTEALHGFLKPYLGKIFEKQESGGRHTSSDDVGFQPHLEISTGSNTTVDDVLVNSVLLFDATGAIDVTLPFLDGGSWVTIQSDSGSAGDITVKNPSAATLLTLEAGDSAKFMKDSSGVYFYEGVASLEGNPNAILTSNDGAVGAMTNKVTVANADLFMLEDPADSNNKYKVSFSNFEGSLDHDSLPGFVANEHISWVNGDGATQDFRTAGNVHISGLTAGRVCVVGTSSALDDTAAFTYTEVGSMFTFNIGTASLKHGQIQLGEYKGGTGTSTVNGFAWQQRLSGHYNLQYNVGNAVKLHIEAYSNDGGDDIYPIFCENENNGECFWVRDNAGTLSAYFGGAVEIDGDLNHDGSNVGFYGTAPISKPTVTGSRGGNAALADLLTELENLGLITDSST